MKYRVKCLGCGEVEDLCQREPIFDLEEYYCHKLKRYAQLKILKDPFEMEQEKTK